MHAVENDVKKYFGARHEFLVRSINVDSNMTFSRIKITRRVAKNLFSTFHIFVAHFHIKRYGFLKKKTP